MTQIVTTHNLKEGEYIEACPNCGCVFTYTNEDIKVHYPDTDCAYPTLQTFVVCPACKQYRRLK